MPYAKVANLLESGQIMSALKVCMDEAPPENPTPHLKQMTEMTGIDMHGHFRQGTALELLWIAYALAKQEKWEDASEISIESFKIWQNYGPPEDIMRLLFYLQLAADATVAREQGFDHMKLRRSILDELVPNVERTMREKAMEG